STPSTGAPRSRCPPGISIKLECRRLVAQGLPAPAPHVTITPVGAMAEWLKAAVLKTAVGLCLTGGSNPSRSASAFDALQQHTGRCQSGRLGPPAKRLTG